MGDIKRVKQLGAGGNGRRGQVVLESVLMRLI